ncbi:integrin alpha [Nonomuraea salmonea]|uniref:integrin alpha n=1 Tax=Nonomuraea salmonea TaxID=46181 RepID=UPI0031EA4C3D
MAAVAAIVVTVAVLIATSGRNTPITANQAAPSQVAGSAKPNDVGRRFALGPNFDDPVAIVAVAPECGLKTYQDMSAAKGQLCVVRWTMINPGGERRELVQPVVTMVDDRGAEHDAAALTLPPGHPAGRAAGQRVRVRHGGLPQAGDDDGDHARERAADRGGAGMIRALVPLIGLLAAMTGVPAVADTAACAGAADFDGDGVDDVVVGDPFGDEQKGAVHVLSAGKVVPVAVPGPAKGDGFGWSVRLAQVNGDACADLVVGAPYADVDGVEDAGAAYVIFGGQAAPRSS